jgi:hypothetical protein
MGEVSNELVAPGVQSAAEPGQFGDRAAPQRGDELGGLRTSLVGVGELVEGHDLLGDGPSDADFAVRVAGDESRLESGPRLDGQVIDTAAQYPADALKRVAGTAAVPGLGLLNPATHVIHGS